MRTEAKSQANFTALVGICLKKIKEETGVLQKWKQRRETDTAKEKGRESYTTRYKTEIERRKDIDCQR